MIKGLVSIIIPTYNRAYYLNKAINSVLDQTYQNFEIIVINDGSTDHTREVLLKLNDKRMFIIELKENQGAAKARNVGMDIAKGEFVAFHDDDDYWHKSKVEKQIKVLKDRNYSLVSCEFNKIVDNKIVSHKNWQRREVRVEDLLYRNFIGGFSFCMTMHSYIKDIRIDEELKACQDRDFWIKVLKGTGKTCYVIPEALVFFNYHTGPRISEYKPSRLQGLIRLVEIHKADMKKSIINFNKSEILLMSLRIYSIPLRLKIIFICKCICYLSKSPEMLTIENISTILGKIRWNGKYHIDKDKIIKIYKSTIEYIEN